MSERYKNELDIAENNRQRCTICGRSIPKNVDRFNFSYRTQWGCSHFRICSYCLEQLYLVINKKPLEEWKEKIMIDEI